MTGPSFPFFQPNVTPSFTFQNPGDAGAVGMELHGLAKAFGEMQEREQLAQAQAQEHEMSMQALALRQLQEQTEQKRLQIAQKEAQDRLEENKHRRAKEAGEIERKKSEGRATKDALVGSLGGVADATTPDEALPGGSAEALLGTLAAMFGEPFGGTGTGVADDAVEGMLDNLKKAQGLYSDPNAVSPDVRAQLESREKDRENQLQLQRMQDAAALARQQAQIDAANARAKNNPRAGAMQRQKQVEYGASLRVMAPADAMLGAMENVDPSMMAGVQRASEGKHPYVDAFINGIQNPEQQLQMIASSNFASNWLRFVSGLAATDAERVNVMRQTSPMYGDTPEVKVYKATVRKMMIGALSAAAAGNMGNGDAATVLAEYNNVFEKETTIDANDSPALRKAKAAMRTMWANAQNHAANKAARPDPAMDEVAVPENVNPEAAAVAGQDWGR